MKEQRIDFKDITRFYSSKKKKIESGFKQLSISNLKSIRELEKRRKEKITKLKGKRSLEIKKLKISRMESSLNLIESDYIKIQQRKKKIYDLALDIKDHLADLNKEIDSLKETKNREKQEIEKMRLFLQQIGLLEKEAASISKTRNALLIKEKKIVEVLKRNLSPKKNSFMKLNGSDKEKIKEVQNTKTYILEEAKHLLTEANLIKSSDFKILKRVYDDKKAMLNSINRNLGKLSTERGELMRKYYTQAINEEKLSIGLQKLQEKQKEVQDKIKSLLR